MTLAVLHTVLASEQYLAVAKRIHCLLALATGIPNGGRARFIRWCWQIPTRLCCRKSPRSEGMVLVRQAGSSRFRRSLTYRVYHDFSRTSQASLFHLQFSDRPSRRSLGTFCMSTIFQLATQPIVCRWALITPLHTCHCETDYCSKSPTTSQTYKFLTSPNQIAL